MFYELEDGPPLSPGNVENRVVDVLSECNQVRRVKAQCVLLTVRGRTIQPRLIEPSEYGVFPNQITSIMECYGEIGPKAVAKHYLKRLGGYEDRGCADTAPQILTILKEASEAGTYVGDQSEYGFDLVLFRSRGICQHTRITDPWGILTSAYSTIAGAVPNFVFTEFDEEEEAE